MFKMFASNIYHMEPKLILLRLTKCFFYVSALKISLRNGLAAG